ncbi:MAG: thioredoxin domain-containing protein [Thermomicrobiales bacterium]
MTTPSSPSPRKKSTSSPDRTSRRQARAEEAARKQRQKRLMTLLAVVLVVAIAGTAVFAVITSQGNDTTAKPLASPMSLDAIPQSGMTLGVADAPVTVIEYADFQCPYCANFALQQKPEIVQKYIATGQVKFQFQPMPILSSLALDDPNNESVRAAEGGYCAADQGKFWDFYALLYSKQTGENVGNFTTEKLISYAQEGGLDVTTFTTCLNNRTHLQDVLDSRQQGTDAGVTGTPTFFVNGTKILGSGKLEETIESALHAAS